MGGGGMIDWEKVEDNIRTGLSPCTTIAGNDPRAIGGNMVFEQCFLCGEQTIRCALIRGDTTTPHPDYLMLYLRERERCRS